MAKSTQLNKQLNKLQQIRMVQYQYREKQKMYKTVASG